LLKIEYLDSLLQGNDNTNRFDSSNFRKTLFQKAPEVNLTKGRLKSEVIFERSLRSGNAPDGGFLSLDTFGEFELNYRSLQVVLRTICFEIDVTFKIVREKP